MNQWIPTFPQNGAFIDGVERSATRSVGSSHQVLLVEDHPSMRRGIKSMLEDAGWDVIAECGTVAEARYAIKPSTGPWRCSISCSRMARDSTC